MNNSRMILILILAGLFITMKMGQAAKTRVQQNIQLHETQLEKAMMDLD